MQRVRPGSGGDGPNGAGRVGTLGQAGDRLLVDWDLEAEALGACLLVPSLILGSELRSSDFTNGFHQRVWSAILAVLADGGVDAVGTSAVVGLMRDLDQLPVDGTEQILGFTDRGIPQATDFKRLRRLTAGRNVKMAAAALANAVGADPEQYVAWSDRLATAMAELESIGQGKLAELKSVSELATLIEPVGFRFPFGLPTLDSATRGGMPLGRLVTLVGAPGSSKTNFVCWLADSCEKAGAVVLIIAADEARASIIVRMGQLAGFDVDQLEEDDDAKRKQLSRAVAGRAYYVVDPTLDKMTIERAGAALEVVAGDRPRVLIVDSVQTAPGAADVTCVTKFDAIEARVMALRGIANGGALVIAISEMGRAGYRTGDRGQDISALGAGAGSRAFEFQSDLLLGLRPVKNSPGLTDIEVAKNRLGRGKPELRVSMDFHSVRFKELGQVDHESDAAELDIARTAKHKRRVLETIRAHPGLKSAGQVVAASRMRKASVVPALRELMEEGALCKRGGVYAVGSPLFDRVVPAAAGGDDE